MPDEVVFNNKAKEPDEKKLEQALGKNYALWQTIREHISERHGPVEEEWKFYGKDYGWQLKLLLKKRNLLFMVPKSDSSHYPPPGGSSVASTIRLQSDQVGQPRMATAPSGYFRLIFIFGDKAVDAVDRSTLPESLRKALRDAKRYAEGRGLRIEVKDFIGVEIAKKLIDIKVNN